MFLKPNYILTEMKHVKQKINLVLSLVTVFLLLPALSIAQNTKVAKAGFFETFKTPMIIILAIIVAIGLLFVIEKVIPRKLRPVFAMLFMLASVFFGYKIYNSIMAPVEFKQEKVKRYTAVINNLKDIRDSQAAHKTITGTYAKDFSSLEKFIDTAQFAIVSTIVLRVGRDWSDRFRLGFATLANFWNISPNSRVPRFAWQ